MIVARRVGADADGDAGLERYAVITAYRILAQMARIFSFFCDSSDRGADADAFPLIINNLQRFARKTSRSMQYASNFKRFLHEVIGRALFQLKNNIAFFRIFESVRHSRFKSQKISYIPYKKKH